MRRCMRPALAILLGLSSTSPSARAGGVLSDHLWRRLTDASPPIDLLSSIISTEPHHDASSDDALQRLSGFEWDRMMNDADNIEQYHNFIVCTQGGRGEVATVLSAFPESRTLPVAVDTDRKLTCHVVSARPTEVTSLLNTQSLSGMTYYTLPLAPTLKVSSHILDLATHTHARDCVGGGESAAAYRNVAVGVELGPGTDKDAEDMDAIAKDLESVLRSGEFHEQLRDTVYWLNEEEDTEAVEGSDSGSNAGSSNRWHRHLTSASASGACDYTHYTLTATEHTRLLSLHVNSANGLCDTRPECLLSAVALLASQPEVMHLHLLPRVASEGSSAGLELGAVDLNANPSSSSPSRSNKIVTATAPVNSRRRLGHTPYTHSLYTQTVEVDSDGYMDDYRRRLVTLTTKAQAWRYFDTFGASKGTDVPAFWLAGMNGSGQGIQFVGVGVNTESCFFTNVSVRDHITNYEAFVDAADGTGAGTHIAAIAAGLPNNSIFSLTDAATLGHYGYRGVAYGSQVSIFDIGDANGGLKIPLPLSSSVYQTGYLEQAKIVLNGWSADWKSEYNKYTTLDTDVDMFSVNYDDALVIFPAGNHGRGGKNTVITPGLSKNSLTVGAHNSYFTLTNSTATGSLVFSLVPDYTVAYFSGMGPTNDGRQKPDVVAPGVDIDSANGLKTCVTSSASGTTRAAAYVAGVAALLKQYFADGWQYSGFSERPASGFNASGALIKAVIINSGDTLKYQEDIDSYLTPSTSPDNYQGWGRVDIAKGVNLYNSTALFVQDRVGVRTGMVMTYKLTVIDNSTFDYAETIDVTVTWMDPVVASFTKSAVLHDIDLLVENEKTGTKWYPNGKSVKDSTNNVEKVTVPHGKLSVGDVLSVTVTATSITTETTQTFALAASGSFTPYAWYCQDALLNRTSDSYTTKSCQQVAINYYYSGGDDDVVTLLNKRQSSLNITEMAWALKAVGTKIGGSTSTMNAAFTTLTGWNGVLSHAQVYAALWFEASAYDFPLNETDITTLFKANATMEQHVVRDVLVAMGMAESAAMTALALYADNYNYTSDDAWGLLDANGIAAERGNITEQFYANGYTPYMWYTTIVDHMYTAITKPGRVLNYKRYIRCCAADAGATCEGYSVLADTKCAYIKEGIPDEVGTDTTDYTTHTKAPFAAWPTLAPTSPTKTPTKVPTRLPTTRPSKRPSTTPSTRPTRMPTERPTKTPSLFPTTRPTKMPTLFPTTRPSKEPTVRPTKRPSRTPTTPPTKVPTTPPTRRPTTVPTERPTKVPTERPTTRPTRLPTERPTKSPTTIPTTRPTKAPTESPTKRPTTSPTERPTKAPTETPTQRPTKMPTERPTKMPTTLPTERPTKVPTELPTKRPTQSPTDRPTKVPTELPTVRPTKLPTELPTKLPTTTPTERPTKLPTVIPTTRPTGAPTPAPTRTPTAPTIAPTNLPDGATHGPTPLPTTRPTKEPTSRPTKAPTDEPTTRPTKEPTETPTQRPTSTPTERPTKLPTDTPTERPTKEPTESPTKRPTATPTERPTKAPTEEPTQRPTKEPTESPTKLPTDSPTERPTKEPTESPTMRPTTEPTERPTKTPTEEPTTRPTTEPTPYPTKTPTTEPTARPTKVPTDLPTTFPTPFPTNTGDSAKPTTAPTQRPTTSQPTKAPSIQYFGGGRQ